MVWLDCRNLHTDRPSKSLGFKNQGPFKVAKVHNNTADELTLPPELNIHPVFHPWLLHLDDNQPLDGQTQHEPGPEPSSEEYGETELPTYVVAKILDSALTDETDPMNHDPHLLKYKVLWEGYPNEPTWEPYYHLTGSEGALGKFHSRYKRKPGPHKDWEKLPGARTITIASETARRMD